LLLIVRSLDSSSQRVKTRILDVGVSQYCFGFLFWGID
jgi:hypothetical protein